MPRKKYPKNKPLQQFETQDEDGFVDVTVWANLADEGGRGAWKKRKASDALNKLCDEYADRLFNPLHPPNVCDITLKRLLGKRQTSKLVEDIKKVLRRHQISFSKTALWLLADRLQKTFIEHRVAVIKTQHMSNHIPINSQEAIIRQKMLKGTF